MNILDKINALKANPPAPTAPAGKKKKGAIVPPIMQKIQNAIEKRPQAPEELQVEAAEATALVVDIAPKVQAIPEITSPEQYAAFDKFVGVIEAERKKWRTKVEKALVPLREAKDAIHEMDHSIDDPRKNLLDTIKAKMASWNRKLLVARQEEERIKQQELQKLNDEAAAVERKAQAARTPQMQSRLTSQLTQLRQTVQAVEEIQPETQLQHGEHSHTRKRWDWKVTDSMAIIKAVAAGELPVEILEVSRKAVNVYFKKDRKEVEEWPGIEVFEDIGIAGGSAWREE